MLHDRQSDMQEFEVFRQYTTSEDIGEYNRRIVDYLIVLAIDIIRA